MYKYDDRSSGSRNRPQEQPVTFGSPHFYSDGFVSRATSAVSPPYGSLASISSFGLGEVSVKIVTPRPNISDLVDYLDVTVRVRGRVTVPTQRVNFLVKLDPPGKPTWWKRLWEDPLKVFPNVLVTIELVQVGPSLFPFSNYDRSVLVNHGLQEYLLKLH